MKYTRRSSNGKLMLVVILAAVTAAVTTLTVLAVRLHWFSRLCAWMKQRRAPFTCDFPDEANVTDIASREPEAADHTETD